MPSSHIKTAKEQYNRKSNNTMLSWCFGMKQKVKSNWNEQILEKMSRDDGYFFKTR